MAAKSYLSDDESFLILGTSPGSSLDAKLNGHFNSDGPLKKADIEDALKDLSVEANMAFKAQFKLGDCPSPVSLMAASNIVSDEKSTEELKKRFGELLDENVVLKETLKQNNESMKEQFLLIATCQEDMMNTHKIHKEKFDETRQFIEKLKQENKKLKQDMSRLLKEPNHINGDTTEQDSLKSADILSDKSLVQSTRSGPPSSIIEFVTSPDDDTVNKLTAQLELVEKQRRQVIVENDKLTWQKESLETIIDATTRERDELKEKLKKIELHFSTKELEYITEIKTLKHTVEDLHNKLMNTSIREPSMDELKKRNMVIQQLENKVSSLHGDLKTSQLKILELENVKLELSNQKCSINDLIRTHKEQMQDLNNKVKEAQTVVFQPVRFSISSESDTSMTDNANFVSNVKLYDRTLKHLAELLNSMTNGISDSLIQALSLISGVQEYKLDKSSADRHRTGLNEIKLVLEKQHSAALSNLGQIKGTVSIFEGIFNDYKEMLKKGITRQDSQTQPSSLTRSNVEALTAALVARGRELDAARGELALFRDRQHGDLAHVEVLRAQADIYKADFEAERESRSKIASEKEAIAGELRAAQKQNHDLLEQLEDVRKLSPSVYQQVSAKSRPSAARPMASTHNAATTGNMVYKCPKCMRFSSDQYKVMEDHFDYCLDDFIFIKKENMSQSSPSYY